MHRTSESTARRRIRLKPEPKPPPETYLSSAEPSRFQHSHHPPKPVDMIDKKQAEERELQGQCVSCGQQLFQILPRRRLVRMLSKSKVKKIPISIEGAVARGQCVQCSESDELQTKTAESAYSDFAGSIESDGLLAHSVPVVHHRETQTKKKVSVTCQQPGTAIYSGQFNEHGERHGTGEMNWKNGDKYVGNFNRGARHGHGSLFFADGSEYVGEWERNYMHGSGTRRFPNGDIYVGDYFDGKRHGQGRFYYSNGDMYVGGWKHDSIDGFGRYYYSSGQRFEGLFKTGKRHGKGKLQRIDGELEIYRYEEDHRIGSGVRWSPDRTKAWLLENGRVKRQLSIAEAVSMVYEIENGGGNTSF